MTETIINLDTVNPIEFFGVNNGKLDILKKKFPLLKILSRGTQIKLSGAPEQVESAKEKIDLLLQYLERNGNLTENYFTQILGGDDAETVDHFIDRNPNDILVFGPNGKTVRARTVNQKKLVTASEKNDIVFAIGPAGTGKTYTAVAMAVRALKNKMVKKIILTRPAVEAGARLTGVPVLRVDQPMADQAVATGRRIGVIATLSTTLEPTADLIQRRAALAGKEITLVAKLCDGAFEALMSGDGATHDAKVAAALRELSQQVDVMVLAQASMARVVDALPAADRQIPILASPGIAVDYLATVLA